MLLNRNRLASYSFDGVSMNSRSRILLPHVIFYGVKTSDSNRCDKPWEKRKRNSSRVVACLYCYRADHLVSIFVPESLSLLSFKYHLPLESSLPLAPIRYTGCWGLTACIMRTNLLIHTVLPSMSLQWTLTRETGGLRMVPGFMPRNWNQAILSLMNAIQHTYHCRAKLYWSTLVTPCTILDNVINNLDNSTSPSFLPHFYWYL